MNSLIIVLSFTGFIISVSVNSFIEPVYSDQSGSEDIVSAISVDEKIIFKSWVHRFLIVSSQCTGYPKRGGY